MNLKSTSLPKNTKFHKQKHQIKNYKNKYNSSNITIKNTSILYKKTFKTKSDKIKYQETDS